MQKYELSPDVFACCTNGHIIFLDLMRNQYSGLNRADTRILAGYLEDWSEERGHEDETRKLGHSSITLARSLAVRGLLIPQDAAKGVRAPTKTIPRPERRLCVTGGIREATLSFRDVTRFFIAAAMADFALRTEELKPIVDRLRRRKQRKAEAVKPLDYHKASQLVSIFQYLRPLYPRRHLCLYDSLALIEFLAFYRVFPSWVYGVTAEPFYAHCWVQDAGALFNESVEVACSYTPIMSV